MAMPMTRGVGRAEVLFVSLVAALLLHGGHARPDSDAKDYDPTSCELTTPEATCPSNMFCFESGRAGGINRFAEIIEEPLAGCGLGVYDCVNGTEFDQLCTCFQFMNMVPIREGAFPGDEDYGCEPGGMAGVMMIFAVFHALVDLMVSVSYAWSTVYQLVMIKSLTMKQIITINPATTTLLLCTISSTGILLRQIVYMIALTGNDPDGTLYDATGGVLLACIVVGAAGGVIEVLIMWLDVLKKAKSMKSNSSTIKRLKIGCSVSLVVLLVASIGCMAVGRQDILAYVAMGYFLPIAIVCHIGGKKLRKMLGNKDGSDTAASTAINCVATRMVKLIGMLYLFVIIYIIYYKKVANGYIGYFGIGCAFFVACWVNNLLISYVRFGARKKLTEAGYLLITSKVHPNGTITTGMAMTMQPTTSTSTSDATPRDGGVGGKEIPPLSPILAKLNSFWRMGYQAL
mmetsp:Transcript_60677/g.166619  ORF Transcript_60677/g.166619 Transcript_60677/m.166619 type:complete len:458 (+) Transcript_60677:248-1621(+)